MVDFANLGFEIAGVGLGQADDWTIGSFVLSRAYADYDTGLVDPQAWEDFEEGWNANEGYIYFFEIADTQAASYGTLLVSTKFVENFEELWDSNHQYTFGFSGEAAQYDAAPENFEDFEEGWSSNENYLFAFGGGDTATGTFDSGSPENFEDFEEEWSGNEGYLTQSLDGPPDADYANYDIAPVVAVEDFEDEWVGFTMTTV